MRIREIAQARVRYGYRKIRVLLNREGWDVGKYLVYRLYQEEGLTLKRMKPARRRKAARTREDPFKPTAPNEAWSMDFVMDQLQDGTRFRALTIVDVYTREAVAIEYNERHNPIPQSGCEGYRAHFADPVVSTTAPNTDFTAKLVDVHQDGPAFNVSEGILRRSYLEVQRPSAAEKVYEIHLDLWPTSMVFFKGHRIRLEGLKQQFPAFRSKSTYREPRSHRK
jgi:predicted acyl esterase